MSILSSNGGLSSDNKLHWTTGETIIGGNIKLTQGFHQGQLHISSVDGLESSFEIIAYPNPTYKGIYLNAEIHEKFTFRIYDINGRILKENTYENNEIYVDLSEFKTGTYFIQLYDTSKLLKTFKIEKIN